MDCNHARLLLIFSRKQSELEAADAESLRGHLDNCSSCAGLAGAERHLDAAVGKAMHDVSLPAGLEMRLLDRLAHDRVRLRWRRVLTAGSLAAALLLAVGLSWIFYFGARTTPDFGRLDDEISQKFAGASPETVEKWFHDQGLAMEAPRQLNFGLLITYDTVRFMNRRVPRLVFLHHGERESSVAEVYVLSGDQFNLDRSPEHPVSVEVLRDNPNFHYVAIVYPRGSLDSFRNKDGLQN